MGLQDGFPPIWGEDWIPSLHLEFFSPLKVSEAREKMMLEVAQQHDGHLRVLAFIWDEMTSEFNQWDGEEFHDFSIQFVAKVIGNLNRRGDEKLTTHISNKADQISKALDSSSDV